MAINDNEGWDGVHEGQETRKGRDRIATVLKALKAPMPEENKSGSKTQSEPQSSMGSSNPLTIWQRYYGFLDDEEIFHHSTGTWRIRTYDCIGETFFWNVLSGNPELYEVLENKHNSASKDQRDKRKKLHEELFESKYQDKDYLHRAIHFLDLLGDSDGSGDKGATKETTPWGWSLIKVTTRGDVQKNLDEGEDALTGVLEHQAKLKTGCQLWAPLLTDAEVGSTDANIMLDDPRFAQVVPFLEEIFSLHHIPDADIWGDGPTPLEPEPPPIVLSEGFALDEDMGLWPDLHLTGEELEVKPSRRFTREKLKVNLDNIRQLPPKTNPNPNPKAHITRLGWFDICMPSDPDTVESQVYLLKEDAGKYWGFRLKIEGDAVMISEAFSEGFNPIGYSPDMKMTEGQANGQKVIASSPAKLPGQTQSHEQPVSQEQPVSHEQQQSPEQMSDLFNASDLQSLQMPIDTPEANDGPLRTPSKPNTNPGKAEEKRDLEKVNVRRPLRNVGNLQNSSSTGSKGSGLSYASSSSYQPKQKNSEADKENQPPLQIIHLR